MFTTRNILRQLEFSTDDDNKKLANSIKCLIKNDWTSQESAAFHKVEELAKKYELATETILSTDYGTTPSQKSGVRREQNNGKVSINTISEIYKSSSSKKKWGKLIFKLVREFKPNNCLELGTCLGISASYQILALQLNNNGKFTTIEGAAARAKIANENLKRFHYRYYEVHVGLFKEILPTILKKDEQIDFVFIDGHHDKLATLEYFEMLFPHMATKSILIFDDINWSIGMRNAWKVISGDNRIATSFDLYNWGICIVNMENHNVPKQHFKLAI